MKANHCFCKKHPVRGLYVRAADLVGEDDHDQLILFDPLPKRKEREQLDSAIDGLRKRFGNNAVVWGTQGLDATALSMDAKGDNIVHPVSFFHR